MDRCHIDVSTGVRYSYLDSLQKQTILFGRIKVADTKNVTRIKASDDAPKKAKPSTAASKAVKAPKVTKKPAAAIETKEKKNIFARMGGYFKGAWIELRQVRWPNRRATWALTIAVILFSLFFMGLITLLDAFFKWIFELIIK